ncbi:MAG TPA: hypothetical protein VHU44_04015 [Acidobacteriaceae bacterium]|nr:hypothetical protein [Acidobacteriaceae bacterium]
MLLRKLQQAIPLEIPAAYTDQVHDISSVKAFPPCNEQFGRD